MNYSVERMDEKQPDQGSMPETDRDQELEQARMEGAKLAIATIHHLMGGDLGVMKGYQALVMEDPGMSDNTRQILEQSYQGIDSVKKVLDQLGRIKRLVKTETGGHEYLDLDRSTASNDQGEIHPDVV